MRSNLHKKVLTVRGKGGTHRQTYYVADEKSGALKSQTVATTVTPRERAQVHYGMLWSGRANKDVDEALKAIAATHSVPGNLYKVKIRVTGELDGANGIYHLSGPDRNQIHVSKYAEHPAATAAHEYGHFLDHHLFGSGKAQMSSLGTHDYKNKRLQAELGGLKTAMYSSAAIQSIVQKHKTHTKDKDYIALAKTGYLLEPSEIFARAYAQWIGTRSSPTVKRQIQEQGRIWNNHGYPAQWEDKDFEPIAREFDRLFAQRGLRRNRQ